MRDRRSMIIKIAVVAIVLAGAAILFFIDPMETWVMARCPFLVLTGWQCAGCGTLRALHALLHLRVAEAWALNPFLFFALCVLPLTRWMRAWHVWLFLGVLVAWTIARNILPLN